jgi:hypothetical protein
MLEVEVMRGVSQLDLVSEGLRLFGLNVDSIFAITSLFELRYKAILPRFEANLAEEHLRLHEEPVHEDPKLSNRFRQKGLKQGD